MMAAGEWMEKQGDGRYEVKTPRGLVGHVLGGGRHWVAEVGGRVVGTARSSQAASRLVVEGEAKR